jgi:hypothetical protein
MCPRLSSRYGGMLSPDPSVHQALELDVLIHCQYQEENKSAPKSANIASTSSSESEIDLIHCCSIALHFRMSTHVDHSDTLLYHWHTISTIFVRAFGSLHIHIWEICIPYGTCASYMGLVMP